MAWIAGNKADRYPGYLDTPLRGTDTPFLHICGTKIGKKFRKKKSEKNPKTEIDFAQKNQAFEIEILAPRQSFICLLYA